MKKSFTLLAILITSIFLILVTVELTAEYKFFTPKGSFAVEVSLENPGSRRLRLPIYRNSITSLAVVGEFAIGGTSATRDGLSPFLFAVSLNEKELVSAYDLAQKIPGQSAIQSGFGKGKDGLLFAGTLPEGEDKDGHLISVRYQANKFEVTDLGIPVKNEGIFSLTFDLERGRIYGITHPTGKFFSFDLASKNTIVFDQIVPDKKILAYLGHYSLHPEDYLCRALILDLQGRVYGSFPANRLFRFDPVTNDIQMLENEIPDVWGRHPLGRVDSWALAPNGMLYGGNAGDGQLFKVNPDTGTVTNLGKPILMNRLKCLVWAGDGKLWGVAGARPGYAHLFSYDQQTGFSDFGNPRFVLEVPEIPGLYWRGYQFASMAVSEDGRWVVLGEDEDQSMLMVFPVN